MTQSGKIALTFVILLGAGAIRTPMEIALTRELRAAKLLPEPLHISTRDKIGQTGFAVALGGLRTLVATFYNLRAYTAFTEDRWKDAEESFDTTVALSPSTTYYWVNGAWHLAYNAGHSYRADESLPPLRREELWRGTVLKGSAFLEKGIRNNPKDWAIKADLGLLLSRPDKTAAFLGPGGMTLPELYQKAADTYQAASENGAPAYTKRNWFYNLARVPGKEKEALALGETLAQSRSQRTPTVLALVFVLRMHLDPAQDGYALASSLFQNDDQRAYRALSTLWEDRQEHYPITGLALTLKTLESRLKIPDEKSIIK